MKVVIMADVKGGRISSIVSDIPKPLIKLKRNLYSCMKFSVCLTNALQTLLSQ